MILTEYNSVNATARVTWRGIALKMATTHTLNAAIDAAILKYEKDFTDNAKSEERLDQIRHAAATALRDITASLLSNAEKLARQTLEELQASHRQVQSCCLSRVSRVLLDSLNNMYHIFLQC